MRNDVNVGIAATARECSEAGCFEWLLVDGKPSKLLLAILANN
jgi:hypothetical protein